MTLKLWIRIKIMYEPSFQYRILSKFILVHPDSSHLYNTSIDLRRYMRYPTTTQVENPGSDPLNIEVGSARNTLTMPRSHDHRCDSRIEVVNRNQRQRGIVWL